MKIRLAVIAALIVFAAASYAAPITVQFSGTVTQVPIDDLYGDITVGSLIQISYTFDSTAVDLVPADPATGSYSFSGLPYSMTFTFPAHVFTAADSIQIGILNTFLDQYTVLATGAAGNLTLEVFLQDNSATVFSNDSLPLGTPNLASFVIRDFHFHEAGAAGETQVDGQIAAVTAIPEPSTSAALLIGAAVFSALIRLRKRIIPCAALCASLSSAVFAVDGVILIDQNRALAGNVTPGDAPGFPVSLTQPGSYRLSGNLTVGDPNVSAIEVTVEGVRIDLNGFTITGPGTTGTGYGIVANPNDTTVANGTVRRFPRHGISLGGFSRVENVRSSQNRADGINVANGSLVIGNIADQNMGTGISAQSFSTVRANAANYNSSGGIFAGCPSSVAGNTAWQNTAFNIDTTNFGTPCTRDQNSPAP